MKRTLILPVVLVTLAILTFATAADAEPCAAQNIDIVQARNVLRFAKMDLEAAKSTESTHLAIDHLILNDQSGGPICHTCVTNAYSVNQSRASVAAAEKALAVAKGAYESCLSSYTCGRCNQFGDDHLANPQPNCSHRYVVYTCDSDANTHNQVTCEGCNQTYWQCAPGSHNHVKIICIISRRVDSTTKVVRGKIVGGHPMVYTTGCGKTYWACNNETNHNRITTCPVSKCNIKKDGCDTTYSCASRHTLNSNQVGGNSGTTTSPTVQNNGGGTVGNGGGTGGTSSDRVRCGNAGTRRTSCNKGGYASSSTAHQSVCELGHTYWTCNVAQNNLHGVRHSNRTCSRCGTTFNSRTNGRCTSRWGTIYRWHWEG